MARSREDSPDSAASMLKEALQALVRQLLSENLEALKESGDLPGPGWEPPGFDSKVAQKVQALLGERDERGLGPKARDEVKAIARDITCAVPIPTQEQITGLIGQAVEAAAKEEVDRDSALREALEGKIAEALKGVRVLTEEEVREIVGESVDALVKDRERREKDQAAAVEEKIAEAVGKVRVLSEDEVRVLAEEAAGKVPTLSREDVLEIAGEAAGKVRVLSEDEVRVLAEEAAGKVPTLSRDEVLEIAGEAVGKVRVLSEDEVRVLAEEAAGKIPTLSRDDVLEIAGDAAGKVRVLSEDEVRVLAEEAAGRVRVPTEGEIAQIARREAGQAAPAAEPPDVEAIATRSAEKALEILKRDGALPASGAAKEEVEALVREESGRALGSAREAVDKALGEFRETGREEMIAEVLDRVGRMLDGRGVPTMDEVTARAQEEARKAVEGGGGEERIREVARDVVGGVLAEEAKELVRRIKADITTAIDQKIEAFAGSAELKAKIDEKILAAPRGAGAEDLEERMTGAFASPAFRKSVEGMLRDKEGILKTLAEDLSEPITAVSMKTTEKVLAREAEGLVRQIKIELGKLRTELKKTWDKAAGLPQSEEMEQRIRAVVGPLLEGKGSSRSAEFKEAVEEISSAVASEVSKDSLKGFLGELRDRIGSSIDAKMEEFIESDRLKAAIRGVAEKKVEDFFLSDEVKQTLVGVVKQVAPSAAGAAKGGGANPEEVRKIVGEEILRRTDEAFKDLIPRHVGKYLDEKLPPPEFFSALATMQQVQAEIDKKLKGSSGGGGGGAGGKGWGTQPGETAVFTNLVSKILNSDQLKEAMDDRFKVINNYIKNELVPKAVKKMLDEGSKK
jgi:hypothetical protein